MPYASKAAQSAYQNRWLKQRRLAWIQSHGPCAVCGSSFRLQVDHIDPAKKVSHRIWSWSAVRREGELAKCQVLCLKHHREKTAAARAAKYKHGTDSMYNHGCHCAYCTEAHRMTVARWRAKKKS